MDKVAIKVQPREKVGSSAVRKLRTQGVVPAVVYGVQGSDVISLVSKDLGRILHNRGVSSILFQLEFPQATKNRMAVIKDIQHHPLNGTILNVDFKEISLKEKLVTKVPLAIRGEALGVKEGGVLEQHLWDIKVSCLPMDVPDEYRVDVSGLKIGQFIHVKDLPVDDKVTVMESPEELVLAVIAARTEEDEKAAAGPGITEPEVLKEKKVDAAAAAPAKGSGSKGKE